MIISHILGGLGNQMFQYAAGRALAEQCGTALKLDVSGFAGYRLHNGFELARLFKGPFVPAEAGDIRRMLGWRSHPDARKLLRRPLFAPLRGRCLRVDRQRGFSPDFFRFGPEVYLEGYWQSGSYFKPVEAAVRAAFEFVPEWSAVNRALAEQMTGEDSVSLHVRRGDYVTDRKTQRVLQPCPPAYYERAVRLIAERTARPRFFIFSDDAAWVKQNLKIPGACTYIDHNPGAESWNDMRLMSRCRHHITANSSFSWWGAWLDPRPDKTVVAPADWFSAPGRNAAVVPEEWITL